MTGPEDAPDTDAPDTDAPDTDALAASPRRPASPAAAAASRARRIGGRTTAAGRPGESAGSPTAATGGAAGGPGTGDTTPTSATSPRLVKATKAPKVEKAPKLEKAAKAAKTPKAPKDGAASSGAGAVSWQRWTPAAVLTVAALVLAVLISVWTHGERWDRPSSGSERDQVLAAAKTCLVATNTYKYNAMDAYEKKGLACSGGEFAKQFRTTVEKILRKNAPAVKQEQTLQVNTAGLMDVSDNNQWDVLVYGQISVTNTSQTTKREDPFGAVAHLQKLNGQWRITQLCSQSTGGSADACY